MYTWHGYLGYVTYGGGAISVALGAAEFWTPDAAAPFAAAAAAAAAAAVTVALRLAMPHSATSAGGDAYEQVSR